MQDLYRWQVRLGPTECTTWGSCCCWCCCWTACDMHTLLGGWLALKLSLFILMLWSRSRRRPAAKKDRMI